MTFLLLFFIFSCSSVQEELIPEPNVIEIPVSTINYSTMTNWYFHPNQSFNFLQTYDLDIAVVDENVGSTMKCKNQEAFR